MYRLMQVKENGIKIITIIFENKVYKIYKPNSILICFTAPMSCQDIQFSFLKSDFWFCYRKHDSDLQ